jgi:glycosyltransferase 2 family protein
MAKQQGQQWRSWMRGIVGLLFGAVFLWLAFRQTSLEKVATVFAQSHGSWLIAAVTFYAMNMVVRIMRWRSLLREVKILPFAAVGIALLVGYAANNIFPARLGEIFRANFVGRRYQLSRTAIAGSILVERVLDGLVVVLCMLLGRVLFAQSVALLDTLAIAGGLLFGGIFAVIWVVGRGEGVGRLPLPAAIATRLQSFRQGLSVRRGSSFGRAVRLSLLVWLLEGITLWCVLKSVNVSLGWQPMLLMIGVTSLSTLIPSAPGFVGTYQYSYSFTLGLFGYDPAQGIAAATAFQVFLFGLVTLVGLGIYTYLSVSKPVKRYGSE